ncbi:MAG TPA: DUF1028 domain-containing protein [Usitatibacter sp.]|jgi:uncharacterized Ntn-hydrolase superfamily protein|nr:DUF1028 domain-containing protein [Usitatibacter sp.]
MTWSIVAWDAATGQLAVAVASRFFAVGALCPAIRAGKGALSTQALINPLYARDGLAALDEGLDPQAVVARLVGADGGREVRQLHVVDSKGRSAQHTGRECVPWCGHRAGPGYSMAGNMLAGPRVLEETERAYVAGGSLRFAERLMSAMEAGEAAGGDKRGKQGAAIVIHGAEEYPLLSLRVDDHPEPLAELRRLHAASLERFQAFMQCLPTRADPTGIIDRAEIDARVARFQAERAKLA